MRQACERVCKALGFPGCSTMCCFVCSSADQDGTHLPLTCKLMGAGNGQGVSLGSCQTCWVAFSSLLRASFSPSIPPSVRRDVPFSQLQETLMVPSRGRCSLSSEPRLGVSRRGCRAAAGSGTPGLSKWPQEAGGASWSPCLDSLEGEKEAGRRNVALRAV